MYVATFEAVAVTATQDFFCIEPADDKLVIVHRLLLAQHTDVKDAEEEILRYQVLRGNTTTGSGGTTPTARPLNPSDTAFGGVVEANNTTAASAGTAVALHTGYFNIRIGEDMVWTPETRPITTQAIGFMAVRLLAAPADSITMAGTIYFEELG